MLRPALTCRVEALDGTLKTIQDGSFAPSRSFACRVEALHEMLKISLGVVWPAPCLTPIYLGGVGRGHSSPNARTRRKIKPTQARSHHGHGGPPSVRTDPCKGPHMHQAREIYTRMKSAYTRMTSVEASQSLESAFVEQVEQDFGEPGWLLRETSGDIWRSIIE